MPGHLVSEPHGSFLFAFLSYLDSLCLPSVLRSLAAPSSSATHYNVILLHTITPVSPLHISASVPSRTSPFPEDSVSRCSRLKLQYPLPDTAGAFNMTSKRTGKPDRFGLLHEAVPAPQRIRSSLALAAWNAYFRVTLWLEEVQPCNLCPLTSWTQHTTQA